MKIKSIICALCFGLTLCNVSQANDINLSWTVNTIKSQTLQNIVKQNQFKKYSIPKGIYLQNRKKSGGKTFNHRSNLNKTWSVPN